MATASRSDHFPVIFSAFLDGANQLWDPPNVASALVQRKPDPSKSPSASMLNAPRSLTLLVRNGLTSNHFTRILQYFARPDSTALNAINALEFLDRHTCGVCDLVGVSPRATIYF